MIILWIVCLIVSSISISVPLTANSQRCLITYSVGESETVKLDMKFPPLGDSQMYVITWKNTENNQMGYDRFVSGVYRNELQLALHVIYQICFWFESQTDKQVKVQYTAQSLFHLKQQQVVIPPNFLKIEDLRNTFLNAQELLKVTQSFKQLQQARNAEEDQMFEQTNEVNESVISMTIFQISIIILTGIYQFWALKGYMNKKQSSWV